MLLQTAPCRRPSHPAELTCVCPQVGLQVGALGVGLPAARVRARVRGRPLAGPGAPASFRLGVQQLQRGGRRGEHTPGSGGLEGQAVLEKAVLGGVLVLEVGLRVVEAGGRVVALLEGHGRGAHHLRVAVIHHEIVRAQRWCFGAGDLWGVGHPRLLVGHHAGRAALLLDLRASLGHQTQDWPITVHVGLGLDAVHELRSPEAGRHEEAPVHAAGRAVVGVHLRADHLGSDAGAVGRGAALLQGTVASRVRVCLVEASALPLRGGIVPAGSPLAVAVAAHGKDKIQHVVEVFILFAWGEVAPGAAGGLGLLLALPPLGEERKGRRLAVRPGAGVGGSGAGRAAGAQRGSAGPGPHSLRGALSRGRDWRRWRRRAGWYRSAPWCGRAGRGAQSRPPTL